MTARTIIFFVILPALMLAAPAAWAQQTTTGSIKGTVIDPDGDPVAEAVVMITSAEGPKSVATDKTGQFRFLYLTPGKYDLEVTAEGFITSKCEIVDVRLGADVRLDVTLTPGASDKITVIGTAPVIDLSTTTTGATITSDLMSMVPVGRNFSSALTLAPGVGNSGMPGAENSNPSINGASGLENTYMIDGVNINNTGYGSAGSWSGIFGTLGTGVNFDYIKEVQVKTGGYEPEYGEALGGYVNLITKSGGNTVQGSVFGYYQSEGVEGDHAVTDRINANYDVVGYEIKDFGFEFGGPLKQDKAFWYAAFDPTFQTTTRRTARAIRESSGIDHTLKYDRTIYNYAANMKWLVDPRHTVSFSLFGDPAKGEMGPQRPDALAVDDPTGRFSELTFGGHNGILKWDGELYSNWFAEASVGFHRDEFKEKLAVNQPRGINRLAPVPEQFGGVGWFGEDESQNLQYRLKLNNFLEAAGRHNIRYGVEFQDISYDNFSSYSGDAMEFYAADSTLLMSSSGPDWEVRPDSTFWINRIRVGDLTAKTKADYLAFFLSDTWDIGDNLSVMAGVRYEQETLTGTLYSHSWKGNWAPRFHVTWDPTRDRRSKVSAAYGRFFGKVPNDIAVRAMSSEIVHVVGYPLDSVDLSDPNNPQITGLPLGGWSYGEQGTDIDPDSKLTYLDEFVAAAEREIIPFFNVGATFLYRTLGRTLEDVALHSYSGLFSGDEPQPYYITNPGPETGHAKPSRKYTAITLHADKRWRDNWQLLGSYTWSRLKGNYEGYYRRDNGQADPYYTSMFDFKYLEDPDIFKYLIEDGLLPNDRTHVVNLYGSHRFDFGLNFGLSVKIQSGVPITRMGFNAAYGAPGEIPLEERGASGRTPATSEVGLHFDYAVLSGAGSKVYIVLDVFNLLNQKKGLDADNNFELGGIIDPDPSLPLDPCPDCENPDFGKPITFQSPRQIRLAVKSAF